MFEELERINIRPKPFEFNTTRELWTDEYISKQMLSFHLDGETDIASRNTKFIDKSVEWISSYFRVGAGMQLQISVVAQDYTLPDWAENRLK